jgi:hypothetical protein
VLIVEVLGRTEPALERMLLRAAQVEHLDRHRNPVGAAGRTRTGMLAFASGGF